MRRVRNLKKPVFWTLLLTFGLWTITAPGQSDSELPLNSTDATAISSDAPDASQQKATITADKQEENNPTFMETVEQMPLRQIDQRFVRHSLDDLHAVSAFLALIFINWHTRLLGLALNNSLH